MGVTLLISFVYFLFYVLGPKITFSPAFLVSNCLIQIQLYTVYNLLLHGKDHQAKGHNFFAMCVFVIRKAFF